MGIFYTKPVAAQAGPPGPPTQNQPGEIRWKNIAVLLLFLGVISFFIWLAVHLSTKKEKKEDPYYFGAGYGGGDQERTLVWSSNGIDWNTTTDGFESFGRFIQYYHERDLWLATGCDTVDSLGTILWSKDGKNWNKIETGGFAPGGSGNHGGFNITYNSFEGLWIAVGGSATTEATIQWSADGKHWNNVTSGGFSLVGKYVYFDHTDKKYIATGSDSVSKNTIQYSTDGREWYISNTDTIFPTGSSFGGLWITGKNR